MAEILVEGLEIYGAIGAVFGLGFVLLGAAQLEKAARGSSIGFRVAILPGAIVLWPYLVVRLLRGTARSGGGAA